MARHQGVLTVSRGGKPLLKYQYEPKPNKVYISQWYTPAGVQILRDSPHDHVHHHALMYAIGIDGIDFWAEVPPESFGRQVPREQVPDDQGTISESGHAVVDQQIRWIAPNRETLAEETRRITVYTDALPGASLLTWESKLQPAGSKKSIKLWGRHYFGLGMRFVKSLDEGSEFLMPDGTKGVAVRGSEELTRAAWCAIRGNADGKPITVAMFDAPDNPRHPASWFTMNSPFAYLAATLNLHEEPLLVSQTAPLKVKYGAAAWDGKATPEQIEEAYQQWLVLTRAIPARKRN